MKGIKIITYFYFGTLGFVSFVQPSSSLVTRSAIATKVAAPSWSLALQRKVQSRIIIF
jgi:hypothetical protein